MYCHAYKTNTIPLIQHTVPLHSQFLRPWIQTFLAFFSDPVHQISTRVSQKMLDPIQKHISARFTLIEVTYLEALLCHNTKILWVGFYSLHPLFPAALNPGETFSVFFLDPVQRISTRSYVSQCQLIYSVITTAISLILGLFPAEILLLMCFCHIKHHHDVAVFCHNFSFSKLHIFAPGLFVSSRF